VVLMAARLIRDKGIEVLCQAALLVAAEVPGVQFQIAGEVDPGNPTSFTTEDIADLAEKHPMVHFLGHRSDMVELFQGATLAVLPAQAREGLPRSLIEACASGLPLVASDVEGVREVVIPGRNGLLVPPGDASALAASLAELLKDPQRRAAMGRESRALAVERFDQEKVLKATLAVYAELGLVPACEGIP
jgi:glycosyltransferase involved in cell wall biosynthesis